MYPEYARDTHTRWILGQREEDFTVDPARAAALIAEYRPSVVLLASPNNPTGTALPAATVEAIYDATAGHGDGVVVVDEAYAEFRRPGVASAVELLAGRPRLCVVRTMSKAFAFAGGRLGYLAGSPDLVDALRVVRLPYHLSAITQAVARAALAHAEALLARVAELRRSRDALAISLRDLGLEVADSDANFLLFGIFDDRHRIWQRLLEAGVLIREVGPPGWLRVSVGTPRENRMFLDALGQVIA